MNSKARPLSINNIVPDIMPRPLMPTPCSDC